MEPKILNNILKGLIWFCLLVILLSPLYVSSKLFFPFIVTKTVAFNLAVLVMFLVFIILAWRDQNYQLKINLALILFGLYIALTFLSSFLGDNFYRSFWSNHERSEGLLLLIHLFIFFWVLVSFFRSRRDWLYVFDLFFAAGLLVSLVALGQYLEIPWLLASSGGQRLAGTIGNAGYMAGYLIFTIFIGLFLFFNRRHLYLKYYYLAVIILEIFIVLNTYTRGGMVALFLAGLIFGFYLLMFYFNQPRLKKIGWGLIILVIILPVLLFLNRDHEIVKNNLILDRIASISVGSNTAENRLMTWRSAWEGFKERPILGWGAENFYQPFDKYFNPKIYRHARSVIWFDRAHNIIFDRLIIGGFIGLLLYLALLFLPFYYLWRHYWQRRQQAAETLIFQGRYYLLPVVFSLLIVAYFIQNFFIFEALVIYIPLFLTLAFVSLFTPHYQWSFLVSRRFKSAVLVVAVFICIPMAYFFTLKPLQLNRQFALALNAQPLTLEQRFDLFKEIIGQNGMGNQEFRRQFFGFFQDVFQVSDVNPELMTRLVKFTEEQLNQQVKENPHSVANYLVLMRFNNMLFNSTLNHDYINKNFELFRQAKPLSPNRQHLYFEIGYAHIYLGEYYQNQGESLKAAENFQSAVDYFEYALNLNKDNFESRLQLISVLIFAQKNQRIIELVDELDARGMNYNQVDLFTQIINTAVHAKNYEIIKFFTSRLIVQNPNNPDFYIQLALAQAYLGENEAAIATAEKIININHDFKEQVDDFIERVRSGYYQNE